MLSILVGVLAAFVAKALLMLIGLFTNLFFFQRWDLQLVSPAAHHLGLWVIGVPVVGSFIVGLMARYGSERIRGHGIPEAIEAILMNGSKVSARVAILKPLSSAISIGSGGPFGAEGPIIMTGGAFGSLVAQMFHLTSAERKTLLVAGAAAGMAAVFSSPVAAVLLAVELLLFELKPRSFVPVALASTTAELVRRSIISADPIFPIAAFPIFLTAKTMFGCAAVGVLAGILAHLASKSVYAVEDAFGWLPVHWMWWPVLGGVVVGIGGYIHPAALGVGYDVIDLLAKGGYTPRDALALLIAKWVMWAGSLGSGTSGGVLAPLLMMGGALGAILTAVLPPAGAPFWPLMAMGAMLGGTMRVPLTASIFIVELTGQFSLAMPLLVSATCAHGLTVLTLGRSILTEKISRRGYHVSREYAIDPLEILLVREVMHREFVSLPQLGDREVVLGRLAQMPQRRGQRLYPIVDGEGAMMGVVTRGRLDRWLASASVPREDQPDDAAADRVELLIEHSIDSVVVAHPDEPLRVLAHRMARTGRMLLPVVQRQDRTKVVGLVTLRDVLRGRIRFLDEEQRRERVLSLESMVLRLAKPLPGAGSAGPGDGVLRGPDDGGGSGSTDAAA